MALVVASGHPAVDRYLAEGFDAVPGMSSRFATAICGHLMRRQTELGIKGSIAEIGTFEGRFFIGLALALAEGERAYGFDTFDWPDAGVQERFVANCRSSGADLARIEAVKRDSRRINARELKDLLGRSRCASSTSTATTALKASPTTSRSPMRSFTRRA